MGCLSVKSQENREIRRDFGTDYLIVRIEEEEADK
jgi:hypothetical protein